MRSSSGPNCVSAAFSSMGSFWEEEQMLRKRRQVADRAITSLTERHDRNTCTTSSVARSSNSILKVVVGRGAIWWLYLQLAMNSYDKRHTARYV